MCYYLLYWKNVVNFEKGGFFVKKIFRRIISLFLMTLLLVPAGAFFVPQTAETSEFCINNFTSANNHIFPTETSTHTVVIYNTGYATIDELTVSLSGDVHAFQLAMFDVWRPAGNSVTIWALDTGNGRQLGIRPVIALPAGAYSARVTIYNNAVGISEYFDVSFEVNLDINVPTYPIILSPLQDFAFAAEDSIHTLVVRNLGGEDVEDIMISLVGANANSFRLRAGSGIWRIAGNSITFTVPANGFVTFSIQPVAGLVFGEHIATLAGSLAAYGISTPLFNVSFAAEPAVINLTPAGNHTFSQLTAGYCCCETIPHIVTLRNDSETITGMIIASLSGDAHAFELRGGFGSDWAPAGDAITLATMLPDGNHILQVRPRTCLAPGAYMATITLTSEATGISESFVVSVTVTGTLPEGVPSIILYPSEDVDFPHNTGQDHRLWHTVTIQNTGSAPTGGLRISLTEGDINSFRLSHQGLPSGATSILLPNISAGGHGSFTVRMVNSVLIPRETTVSIYNIANGISETFIVRSFTDDEIEIQSFEVVEEFFIQSSPASLIIGEDTSLRDCAFVRHYLHEDGAMTTAIFEQPVQFLDVAGNWQDIDNTLQLQRDTNGNTVFVPVASNLDISIPQYFSNDQLTTISQDGYSVAFGLIIQDENVARGVNAPSRNRSRGQARTLDAPRPNRPRPRTRSEQIAQHNENITEAGNLASAVVFEDVLPGVELEYIVTSHGVSEQILIHETLNEYTYYFQLELDGLVPMPQADGSILLFRESDASMPQFVLQAPMMFDAAGEVYAVDMELRGDTVVVTADADWINAATMPVTIVPMSAEAVATILPSRNREVSLRSDGSTNSSLYAGTDSNGRQNRIFMHFDLASIPSDRAITRATLHLHQNNSHAHQSGMYLHVYELERNWPAMMNWQNTSALFNNRVGSRIGESLIRSIPILNTRTEPHEFDLLQQARQWYNVGGNHGIVIATNNEGRATRARLNSSGNLSSSRQPRLVIEHVQAVRGITATSPSLDFGTHISGYSQRPVREVTIRNIGNVPITLNPLPNVTNWVLTPSANWNTAVEPNTTRTFTIRPANGLGDGTYNPLITITGSGGVSAQIRPTFTVIPRIYNINLEPTDTTIDFGEAVAGYSNIHIRPHTRTVTNAGNVATGTLTVSLEGDAEAFQLATSSGMQAPGVSAFLSSIPEVGSINRWFSIRPIDGLAPGIYTAIVRIGNSNVVDQIFSVSFTVIELNQSLSFEPDSTIHIFPARHVNYNNIDEYRKSLQNIGNVSMDQLTVTLEGEHADAFQLQQGTNGWQQGGAYIIIPNMAIGSTNDFSVRPVNGLERGNYTAIVRVGNANETAKIFNVSFTVNEVSILERFHYAHDCEEGQWMNVYFPTDIRAGDEANVVLFIHGGAYMLPRERRQYIVNGRAQDAAEQGFVAVAMTYRLLNFQGISAFDMLDDVHAAVVAIYEMLREMGITPRTLTLEGRSAGGHLALLYGYTRQNCSPMPISHIVADVAPVNATHAEFFDIYYEQFSTLWFVLNYFSHICCIICAFGASLDLPNIKDGLSEQYCGCVECLVYIIASALLGIEIEKGTIIGSVVEAIEISPIFHVSSDSPPILLRTAGGDAEVPYSQGILLMEALELAGGGERQERYPHEYEGVPHYSMVRTLVVDGYIRHALYFYKHSVHFLEPPFWEDRYLHEMYFETYAWFFERYVGKPLVRV